MNLNSLYFIWNRMNLNIYYSNVIFKDIAQSLEYVFQKRNISVTLTHKLDSNNKNMWIILGANELPPSTLLPPNYIIYQLEQIYLKDNKWLTEKYIEIMKRAKIVWDYCKKNTFVLQSYNIKTYYVPISYAPCLTSNLSFNLKEKDIDFLFIGSLNQRRLDILNKLKSKNYNVMIADGGLWGNDRSELLHRTKCVLNIHFYNEESPLEMARVSILLSNKCFIISELGGDSHLEKHFDKGILFCSYKDIIKNCEKYIQPSMESKRNSIAQKGFQCFSKLNYSIPDIFYKYVKEYSTCNSLLNTGIEVKPISEKDTIEKIELLIDSDGYSSIKVPELLEFPTVSIITPTKNRKLFIGFLIHQVEKLDYPREKLEWILVDDSDNKEDFEYISDNIKNILNSKIKYTCIHLEGKNTISFKRNFAIKQSTGKYICHMDDDDFYFSHSLKTKISFLEHYKHKECIGTTELPVYNLIDDTSILTKSNYLSEASMVYSRTFWENNEFEEHLNGEGYLFTIHNRDKILDIPYLFNMIAINHGKNVTGKTRLFTGNSNLEKSKENKKTSIITNLLDAMDEESQDTILSIKTYRNSKND